MTTRETATSLSYEARVDRRFSHKAGAVADRLRTLKGDTYQSDLAERAGKSSSTVSNHLSGRVNLTLRTIAEYEVALEGTVVTVPDLKRPQRRRRSLSGDRRVSDEQKAVADIDPAKRRLHRLLTDVSARIAQLLDEREDLSQKDLADRMGKDGSYVSRVLGGGVNLTLKTIAQFEEALDACVLKVEGHTYQGMTSGTYRGGTYAAIRKSSDGGGYVDWHGGVTKTMTRYVQQENDPKATETSACAEYA